MNDQGNSSRGSSTAWSQDSDSNHMIAAKCHQLSNISTSTRSERWAASARSLAEPRQCKLAGGTYMSWLSLMHKPIQCCPNLITHLSILMMTGSVSTKSGRRTNIPVAWLEKSWYLLTVNGCEWCWSMFAALDCLSSFTRCGILSWWDQNQCKGNRHWQDCQKGDRRCAWHRCGWAFQFTWKSSQRKCKSGSQRKSQSKGKDQESQLTRGEREEGTTQRHQSVLQLWLVLIWCSKLVFVKCPKVYVYIPTKNR